MPLLLLALFLQSDLDAVVTEILQKDKIPGAVILAGTKDAITCRKAFGTAKIDTVWDLASCTKIIATTTAAMILVEQGKLSLDDPLEKYLPAFKGRDITIRELLVHRSGFAAYLNPKAKTPDAIIEEIAGLKSLEKKFRYS